MLPIQIITVCSDIFCKTTFKNELIQKMHHGSPIRIAISSCLLGENVRYDGQNKYDSHVAEMLSQYVDFVPLCPETGIGLGVPRPPVKLIGRDGGVYAVGVDDPDFDVTEALFRFGKKQAARLGDISGYIFKSRSPSCGITDTPIFTDTKEIFGTGLYARQIIEAIPLLPITDEATLKHENQGDNFLERALAFNRWKQLTEKPISTARLRRFNSLHACELGRHHVGLTGELSKMLSQLKDPVSKKKAQNYLEIFMAILKVSATENVDARELTERHTQLSLALENHAD